MFGRILFLKVGIISKLALMGNKHMLCKNKNLNSWSVVAKL